MDIYPLSPMQEGMFFNSLLDAESSAYFEQISYRVKGTIDIIAIEKSLLILANRHEILRTVFVYDEVTRPLQILLKKRHINFSFEDIRSTKNTKELLNLFKANDRSNTFNLSTDVLMRVNIFQINDFEYEFIWSHHHILMDGWCMGTLIDDFLTIYKGLILKQNPILNNVIPYRKYISWLFKQDGEVGKSYWSEYLKGYGNKLTIPGRSIKKDEQFVQHEKTYVLDSTLSKNLYEIAENHGTTLSTVVQVLWGILLSKYNNEIDIVFGLVVSGRPSELNGVEDIVGLFINTIPVRMHFASNNFETVLKNVQDNILKSEQHHQIPLHEIQALSELKNELIDHILVFENYPVKEKIENDLSDQNSDLGFVIADAAVYEQTSYDLTITVVPGEEIRFLVAVNTNVYSEQVMDMFMTHLFHLISQTILNSSVAIDDLEIITPKEKKQIIESFNKTNRNYPKDKLIQQLFEEQVKLYPNQTALVYENLKMSYLELNNRANQIAHFLRARKVVPDQVIGIMLERSLEMVVFLMGVIKAGCAYLPIDPNYPLERIEHFLRDSQASIILTSQNLTIPLAFKGQVIQIENPEFDSQSLLNPLIVNKPDDLVYIIYTSGSTGNPKGVMIQHKQYLNATYAWKESYNLEQIPVHLLQLASFSFDVFSGDVSRALINGGKMVICSEDVRLDPEKLYQILKKESISIFEATPSLVLPMMKYVKSNSLDIDFLELLILGSDVCHVQDFKQLLLDFGKSMRIINSYGVTEATIDSSYYEAKIKDLPIDGHVPIGKPLGNMSLYVLDNNLNLLPQWVEGNLYIGGLGVGLGYFGNEKLTKDRFIENPFTPGQKLYNTGDRAKWSEDGNIHFFGRLDDQVKLRGFRIELGEIESNLLKIKQITETVVVVKKHKNESKYLCAFYIASSPIQKEQIVEQLKDTLPDYMIPFAYVHLNNLPLTPNGKVDKKALPDYEIETIGAYKAPKNEIESTIIDIWSELLLRPIDKIGTSDNFFEIGGDSIKAIQIMSRLKANDYSVTMKEIFTYPTISELSRFVIEVTEVIDQSTVTGKVELTPIQRHFFDLNIDSPYKYHYNQSVLFFNNKGFDQEAIRQILQKLHTHHDALRMRYRIVGQEVIQENLDLDISLVFDIHNLRGVSNEIGHMAALIEEYQNSLDLENGPLMKTALFQLDDGDRLFIVIHHLIIDGVSWRILFEDIQSMYDQYRKGEKISLPSKTSSYKDWASHLVKYVENNSFKKELFYWREIDGLKLKEFHQDKKSKSNRLSDFEMTSFTLDSKLSKILLTEAHEAYGTGINDLLLAGLALSVLECFSLDEFLLTLEGHGREQIIEGVDISRTIGWFTSLYPVLMQSNSKSELSCHIKNVKEQLRKVPNKGIGYGIYKFLTNDYKEFETSKPQIAFNYLGGFGADIKDGDFSLAKESSGISQNKNLRMEHVLEVTTLVQSNQMEIMFFFNRKHFFKKTIDNLKKNYQNQLKKIADACLRVKTREFTPSDYLYKDLSFSQLDDLKRLYDIEEIYPLSPMQEGMLFNSLLNNESAAYFEQISYSVKGSLNIEAVKKSLELLTERHPILRTAFVHEDLERPLQVLLKSRSIDFSFDDIRNEEATSSLIHTFKESDRENTFELDTDILMRVRIFQIENTEYEFIWSHHHILMDGWCMAIIVSEFMEIYKSLQFNREPLLKDVVPYKNYISWLIEQDHEKGQSYWSDYLAGYANRLYIPGKVKVTKDFIQKEKEYSLDKVITSALQRIANTHQTTLSTLIQTLWGILLSKYNGGQEVVFGSVVSGRPSALHGVEDILGLFINTVPIRINISDKDFGSLIQDLQAVSLESQPFHHIPLHDIQSLSPLKNELIDHVLVFENYPVSKELEDSTSGKSEDSGFNISSVEIYEQTNYDLTVTIMPGEEINFVVAVNTLAFSEDSVDRLMSHLFNLAYQVIKDPISDVCKLEIVTSEEKQQILKVFNDSSRDYPKDEVLQELFEQQVVTFADSIALVHDGQRMTYDELNKKSNKIAHYLRSNGIVPNQVVGIMLERSMEMVVVLLGVVKSGAAYLPIDPSYPTRRIEFFLDDSKAPVLLTSEKLSSVYSFAGEIVHIENPQIHACPTHNPKIVNNAKDMLYMLYTSGSTGDPKGVMIQHEQYINVSHTWKESYRLDEIPVNLLQMASFSFDVFSGDISRAFLNGGKMVICPEDVRLDPKELYEIIREESISIMETTPALAIPLMDYIKQNELDLSFMRLFIIGSDILHVNDFRRLLEDFGNTIRIINSYGVSEATIDTSFYETNLESLPKTGHVPIGKPMGNMQFYVLDSDMNVLPIGVPGDLYIGGLGVGLGYFGRAELTSERFLENPFISGSRIYRTGDLARWLDDGNMEFIGRSDNQIKVRGFRIEIGEIERSLLNIKEITKAVVSVREREDGSNYLCGYYIALNAIEEKRIITELRKSLPDYMIPFFYIHLEEFPLTPNGKIDKIGLPAPAMDSKEAYIAPKNAIESIITEIWSEVLIRPIDKISTKDNFFEMGGDSIKTMYLRSKFNKAVDMDVAIATFFEYPTIVSFCEFIQSEQEVESANDAFGLIEEESFDIMNNTLNLIKDGNKD
ncbi:amino acid adenylation domain-containing protein [Dokdonia sp.]|uniref:amino acid adenylation domain-containing protein n=1 Tax=Dokdonia sp. TaxID=2024995 RepID=UPI003266A030